MDATGWGLEAGLNHILSDKVNQSSAAAAAERGKARERYHARLRCRYLDCQQVDDPTARLDDFTRLHRLLASVCSNGRDRQLLLATGFGHDGEAVARIVSMKPDAVRQRIARLRTKMVASC